MEDDTGADSTTHRADKEQETTNETTNSTTSTAMTDKKEVGGTEQGNSSSDQGKTASNTTTNDAITSLAELRPALPLTERSRCKVKAGGTDHTHSYRDKNGERKDTNVPGSLK